MACKRRFLTCVCGSGPANLFQLIFGLAHTGCYCWSTLESLAAELLEGARAVFFLRIEPRIRVLLGNICSEVITDEVIKGELIPVEQGEPHMERTLVFAHEQK